MLFKLSDFYIQDFKEKKTLTPPPTSSTPLPYTLLQIL